MSNEAERNEIIPEGTGFKFLSPDCCTYYHGKPFPYPVPGPGEKWGRWFEHPNPAEPDGDACGPGRLHIMLGLNAKYAPIPWHPWWAQWSGEIGRDEEKVGVRWCRLRRVTRQTLWRALRPPFNWGRSADLIHADLSYADLSYADLSSAVLRSADLSHADLSYADLSYADLSHADLSSADLSHADLSYADLRRAVLSYAKLDGVIVNQYTLWPMAFEVPSTVILKED